MKKNISKSYQGYINKRKKYAYIYAMLFLMGILGIFFIGIYLTRTRLNWLTIVAVFFCLPFAKAAVAAIVITPYKSVDKEFTNKLNNICKDNRPYYELVLNDEKNFYNIDGLVIANHEIVGFVSNKKTDLKKAENHIKKILKSENITGYIINLKSNLNNFYERAYKLNENIDEASKEEKKKIFDLFINLSL